MKYGEQETYIAELIYKKVLGIASSEEEQRLSAWLAESPAHEEIRKRLTERIWLDKLYHFGQDIDVVRPMLAMDRRIRKERKPFYMQHWAQAAMFVSCFLLLIGIYLFSQYKEQAPEVKKTWVAHIQPGETKALLTLEDGSTVALQKETQSITHNEQTIAKVEDGHLSYQGDATSKPQEVQMKYNHLRIPKGGEYQLTLSDGTKVWLNSDTYLKFPVAFTANERKVYLDGEAYFEVTPNAKSPFLVESKDQTIRVLGTSFNVSAYSEENNVYTTLVTGSVKVCTLFDKDIELVPGQQSICNLKEAQLTTRPVNVDEIIGWKSGMFVFENQSLAEIMKKLSRWYDFSYHFETAEIERIQFKGKVPRYTDFSEILDLLEESGGLKFRVEDKQVIIKESNQTN